MGSTGYGQNIPVNIILPNNYKEIINANPTHIAEYLLIDEGFLNKEVDSNIAIEFYI